LAHVDKSAENKDGKSFGKPIKWANDTLNDTYDTINDTINEPINDTNEPINYSISCQPHKKNRRPTG
jgi:hypothetical protein